MATSLHTFIAEHTDKDGNLNGVTQETLLELIAGLKSENSQPKKQSKGKKSKDPNAPKRGRNAYMIYLSEHRATIKTELGEGVKSSEISKEAGKRWAELSEDDRIPYITKAEEEKKAYTQKMAEYKPSETQDKHIEAPDGWSGPFLNCQLAKKVKDSDGKVIPPFKTFEEAIEAAGSYDDCGGITLCASGWSLRVNKDRIAAKPGKEKSAQMSFIKGQPKKFTIKRK